MSTQEEKEKQQRALDEKKYMREEQMAILKASNQMLDKALAKVEKKLADDPKQLAKLTDEIKSAKEDNITIGNRYLNAGKDEIENTEFKEASNLYKEKYKRHLENIGKTDEEMQINSGITEKNNTVKATTSSKVKKDNKKKIFSFSKKKNEINEDGEEIISEIDQKKRTVFGVGYIGEKDVDSEKENIEMEKEENKIDVNSKIEEKLSIKNIDKYYEYPDFDPASVNPLIRYDIIELPSHGECYKNKKGRIPVRELTASDENLIASPNMYANGQLIETILKRCILDKSFNVDEMCSGDRDAVVMWLRATAYGPEYNVSATNPETGKLYSTTINLSDFKYKEFNIIGDENGYFDYTFENGDLVKFKILSFKELAKLQEEITLQYINQKKYIVYQKINDIKYQVNEVFTKETGDEVLNDAIDYIYEWANNDSIIKDEETLYSNFMTSTLISRIVSVNGNEDKNYIEEYINNLRISDSRKLREYIFTNNPGVDFSMSIEIPESEGGGSFDTTFQYGDTIFIS